MNKSNYKLPLNLKGLPEKEIDLWERYLNLEEAQTRRMTYRGVLTADEQENKKFYHDYLDESLKKLVKV